MDFFSGGSDAGTLGLGLLIAGAAAGLFSGLLGRGAGLILVPALYQVAEQLGVATAVRFPLAAGTSLACLLPLSLNMAAHHAKALNPSEVKQALPFVAMGLVLGMAGLFLFPAMLREIFFGLFALAVVVVTFWASRSKRVDRFVAKTGAAQTMAGLITGTTGIALALSSNTLPSRKASEALAWFIAIAVTAIGAVLAVVMGWNAEGLPKYSYGFFNLLGFGIVAPVMFATSAVAAHYRYGVDAKRLIGPFAIVVVITTGKMLWDALG
ncbi:putative membrane protein YfcA [Rhizomicrobium palustre]|uniref:Probable membrane transporter protein n=1 Tax=Rhizomicrobium palustre TaxID=189966 RepID=A0A846N042_9PROT|nr:sulfite exporter TauE/SafE family protein [Rhizomicrobium palustre]NIK88869.1 putative membrane protein YfcA [Rhizomicrobium palustre]